MDEPLKYELELWQKGIQLVAGIDEVGRGPFAGPVVASAVIFPRDVVVEGVDDSKKLSAAEREALCPLIRQAAVSVGVGMATHEEINRINIVQATFLAMHRAVYDLGGTKPHHLLVDGNRFNGMDIPYTVIVGGDRKSHSIAAASIIAKVIRDGLMVGYDKVYPGYGFAFHKGYGTRRHRQALSLLGPCAIHRAKFVRKCVPKG